MPTAKKFGIPEGQARAYLLKALAVFLFCVALSAGASAQVNSSVGPVNLSATMASSLTVTVTPNLVNFTLATSGTSNGSSPITLTTSWAISTFVTRVSLYAYFTTAASALSDAAGKKIPSANVSGSVNGGAFRPFTGNSPFAAGTSLRIFRQRVFGFNSSQSRTDTLNLQINTTGLGLGPGYYTGTLVIQAQAL